MKTSILVMILISMRSVDCMTCVKCLLHSIGAADLSIAMPGHGQASSGNANAACSAAGAEVLAKVRNVEMYRIELGTCVKRLSGGGIS